MSGIHEVAEHVEHAAHEAHGDGGHGDHGGGSKSIARYVGLTMAVLGVFLALCSALVGSQRTELVQTMVRQANTFNEYQAASTKYRLIMTQLEQTYAMTPSRSLTKELDGRLAEVKVPDDQAGMATLQRDVFKDLSTLLTPRKLEVESLLSSVERYNEERQAAKAWAQSYDDEVKAHAEAAEDFEKAQLLAEVGIVVASIALLLSNKPLWFIAVACLVGSGGTAGRTFFHTNHEVHEAEEKIEHAKEHYTELRELKDASGKRLADAHDEEILAKIRERFGVAETPKGTEHGTAEHAPGPHDADPARGAASAHGSEPSPSASASHGSAPAHGAPPARAPEHPAPPAPKPSPNDPGY